jgi:hypothetical protein
LENIALDSEQAQKQAEYQQKAARSMGPSNQNGNQRNYNEVTCYKCQEKGHYANVCPNQQVKRFKIE